MSTEILDLDEVTSSLGDKFITHNTALRQLEAKLIRVLSRTNGGPPGSIVNGDTYIVDVASGIWAAATVGDIAHAYGGAYYFYTPAAGWRVEVVDEGYVQKFDGTDWDDRMLHTKDDLSSDGTLTVVSGEIVVGPGGGGADPELDDNTARAYVIKEGANDYLVMTTTDGSETITYGNSTTKPTHIFENGKTGFGGETDPDCGDGGLTLHHDSNNYVFTIKNPAVAHGATGLQETDTYLAVSMLNGTDGGWRMRGFGEVAQGIELEGFAQNPNTGDTAVGIINFRSWEISGTSTAVPGSDDNICTFMSGSVVKVAIKGDGRSVGHGIEVTGGGEVAFVGGNSGGIHANGSLYLDCDSNNSLGNGNIVFGTNRTVGAGGSDWVAFKEFGAAAGTCDVLMGGNLIVGQITANPDEVIHAIASSNPTIKVEQSGSATYAKIQADGTDMNIGTAGGAGAINFKVNDVTQMTLDSSGDLIIENSVGFGTSSPTVRGHFYGTSNLSSRILVERSDGNIAILTAKSDAAANPCVGSQSNHDFSILTNDTERITVDSSTGDTTFQAGIALSAGTDLLDTYEEGDWTPELWDDTLATEGTPPTYTVQVGTYTRIGDLVHVQGRLSISSLGGLTSGQNLRLGGLPFTAENVANAYSTLAVGYARGMSITLGTSVSGFVVTNASHIEMELGDSTVGSRSMLVSEFSATGSMMFSAIYKA